MIHIQILFYIYFFFIFQVVFGDSFTSEEILPKSDEEFSTPDDSSQDLNLKGNRLSLFWAISVFSSSSQNFFQQFFSAFARLAGVSASVLGFLMSIRNLLSGLFQGLVGRLSDIFGRKFILIIGFILGLLIPIPLLFFESTWLLITVAIIQAFAISVVIPSWNAVLGDVTELENRASFIGKITSIGRIISVIFALLIALLFFFVDHYSGSVVLGWSVFVSWRVQYGVAFAISAFNSLLCIITMIFFKETRLVDPKNNHVPRMRVAFQDKNFVKFLIVNSVWGITMALIWPANPIILVDHLTLTFWQIAIMTSSFTIFIAIAQILGGKLSDKIGRKPLIIISIFILIFFPVIMIPAITSGSWSLLILSRFVGGIGTGINLVAVSAYTLDLAPKDLMGGYSGIREVFYGIATFIGSFISGFIIDAFLTANYTIKTTMIIMSIGVTVLRVFAATGFLFISESLPKNDQINLGKAIPKS